MERKEELDAVRCTLHVSEEKRREKQSEGKGHHRVPGSQELVGWFMGLLGFRRQGLFSQRHKYQSWNYTSSWTFHFFSYLQSTNKHRGRPNYSSTLVHFRPLRPHSRFPFSWTMRPPFPPAAHSLNLFSLSLNLKTVLSPREHILTSLAFQFNWKTRIAAIHTISPVTLLQYRRHASAL